MAANPLPPPTLTLVTEKTPPEATVRRSGRIIMEHADQLPDTARKLIAESNNRGCPILALLQGWDTILSPPWAGVL